MSWDNQGCGSGSARIQVFWSDPDPVYKMRSEPDPDPVFKIWLDPDPVFKIWLDPDPVLKFIYLNIKI